MRSVFESLSIFLFPSLSPPVCVCVWRAREVLTSPLVLYMKRTKYSVKVHASFLISMKGWLWELAKVFYFQTYAMSAVESFHTVARILLFHGQMGQTGGRIRTRWTKQGYLKQTDKLSLWDSLELHRHLEGLSNRLGGAIVLHVMDGVSWEYQHRLNANLYYDCNL